MKPDTPCNNHSIPLADVPRPGLQILLLVIGAALLTACGGGGGPGPVSVGSTAPPPPPTPAPGVTFDTAEYRRSNAATTANIIPAWTAGASGAGVTIGFIDSGIASSNPEFSGRILSSSRDVSGQNRGILDTSGHGTSVAAVAAAARDDSGMLGIAYSASLAVMRADNGDCEDGCRYGDSALAAGIDAAVAAGAKVINLSLGGSNGSTVLRNAFARATAAGTVIVISAGNDGEAQVDPLPAAALAATGRGAVIVVGAVDENGAIADFSNRAGTAQENYISALGVRVRSFDQDGTAFLYSGTSYSAPAVAGAIALLAQAFPNLTAPQLVDIILRSARDAGDAGTDAIYGRGILDIGRAMAPSGQTSLAGTTVPVPLGANGNLGSALGDGLSGGTGLAAVPVTDAYNRLYTIALGQTLRPAPAGRLQGRLESASLLTAGTGATLGSLGGNPIAARLELKATGHLDRPGQDSFRNEDSTEAHLGFAQRGVDSRAGTRNPLRETRIAVSAGPLAFTAATGRLATEGLPGSAQGGFVADDGLAADEGTGTSGRQLLMGQIREGRLSVALAASSVRTSLPQAYGLSRTARQEKLTVALGWQHGPLQLAAQMSDIQDEGALLGTRLAPAFGLQGGRSQQLGVAADIAKNGFGLRLAATQGRHAPRLSAVGLLQADGALTSRSWSATAHAPVAGGTVRLRLAQPLALIDGRFRLANGTPLSVAVSAQETTGEIGFDRGGLSVAAFHRRDAGNIPGLSDTGAAFTIRSDF
jgi:hypothetical protein